LQVDIGGGAMPKAGYAYGAIEFAAMQKICRFWRRLVSVSWGKQELGEVNGWMSLCYNYKASFNLTLYG